jgi:hypothetical protein
VQASTFFFQEFCVNRLTLQNLNQFELDFSKIRQGNFQFPSLLLSFKYDELESESLFKVSD